MKNQLFLILLSFLSFNAKSQEDPTTIPLVAYWSIGDSFNFKIQKSKKQWSGETLMKDEQQEYIANFTVIDSTNDSYTILWKYDLNPNEFYEVPIELNETFSKFNQLAVQYKTTETGEFVEILNWKEVSEVMNTLFDLMAKELAGNNQEKFEELNNYFKSIKQLFLSKDGVEQLVYKDLQLLHLAMGQEFETKEPIFVDGLLPNIFGGEPLNASTKIQVEEVDLQDKVCRIKQETHINPDDAKSMLLDLFNRMNLGDDEVEKAFESAVFELSDHTIFEFLYEPCIPIMIEVTREMVIDVENEHLKLLDKTVIKWID